MAIILTDTALLRLLQLSSAALPVGAYAFSQGLEQAVERGWLKSAAETQRWLRGCLQESLVSTDLAILYRQNQAVAANDQAAFDYWNATLLACRETKELRLNDTATAAALIKLLQSLGQPLPWVEVTQNSEYAYASIFALAGSHFKINQQALAVAFAWSWLENQVAAATKLVPLGQTAAQQMLLQLAPRISEAVEKAANISDQELGGTLPALAMTSAWHETQYSRLFRS